MAAGQAFVPKTQRSPVTACKTQDKPLSLQRTPTQKGRGPQCTHEQAASDAANARPQLRQQPVRIDAAGLLQQRFTVRPFAHLHEGRLAQLYPRLLGSCVPLLQLGARIQVHC